MRASRREAIEHARLERLQAQLAAREEAERLAKLRDIGVVVVKPRRLPRIGDET